jgi:hypothetical protein
MLLKNLFLQHRVLLLICLLDVSTPTSSTPTSPNPTTNRSFIISGTNFLKDDEPFQVLSGSIHYFRHLPSNIPLRLQYAKLCGLNAVQTYIHWAIHEPIKGMYTRLDEITSFLKAAQQEGLLVILRPGPYICAETTGGGIPGWLQEVRGGIGPAGRVIPRSGDPVFLKAVDDWFSILLPLLKPYLYSAGGPIIMSQVGNEEGFWSSDAISNIYLSHIRDLMIRYWGNNSVILHTTDSALSALLHGGVPTNVFATVDFGSTENASAAFDIQREANDGLGPNFNSEFYIGGMNSNWGNDIYINETAISRNATLSVYESLIKSGASINMYVFSGGTNWRLEAGLHADGGANWQTGPYIPGGPLNEAGDFTDLGIGVCNAIANATGRNFPILPTPRPKSDYGGILYMKSVVPLWNALSAIEASPPTLPLPWPPTFESLNLESGYVVYETYTKLIPHLDGSNWYIREPRDRAYIFVNNDTESSNVLPSRLGIRQRPMDSPWSPSLPANQTQISTSITSTFIKIYILVGAEGRDCFGPWLGQDIKGIPSGFQLGPYAQPYVFNWTARPLDVINKLNSSILEEFSFLISNTSWSNSSYTIQPAFYLSTLIIEDSIDIYDTFLDMRGWGKGLVAINGFLLGRYWYLGPEYSFYIPSSLLHIGINDIVIFETDGIGAGCNKTQPPGESLLRLEAQIAACKQIVTPDGIPSIQLHTVPVRDLT